MEDPSVFMEKAVLPTEEELAEKLGSTHKFWVELKDFTLEEYPGGVEDWNFPGKKYGWSFRIKDKKRAILYFLPRAGYFMVAFVFGQKVLEVILESNVDDRIKTDLQHARKYAEGRGVRIEVRNEKNLEDIKTLIGIKLAH